MSIEEKIKDGTLDDLIQLASCEATPAWKKLMAETLIPSAPGFPTFPFDMLSKTPSLEEAIKERLNEVYGYHTKIQDYLDSRKTTKTIVKEEDLKWLQQHSQG